jgi:hypothetical protein
MRVSHRLWDVFGARFDGWAAHPEGIMQAGRQVGTIVTVQRYPVKSMGADPLMPADLRWNGLHGDRQYAFLKTNDLGRFPWLTGRDVPSLLCYRARYDKPENPRSSKLTVRSPGRGL